MARRNSRRRCRLLRSTRETTPVASKGLQSAFLLRALDNGLLCQRLAVAEGAALDRYTHPFVFLSVFSFAQIQIQLSLPFPRRCCYWQLGSVQTALSSNTSVVEIETCLLSEIRAREQQGPRGVSVNYGAGSTLPSSCRTSRGVTPNRIRYHGATREYSPREEPSSACRPYSPSWAFLALATGAAELPDEGKGKGHGTTVSSRYGHRSADDEVTGQRKPTLTSEEPTNGQERHTTVAISPPCPSFVQLVPGPVQLSTRVLPRSADSCLGEGAHRQIDQRWWQDWVYMGGPDIYGKQETALS